MSFLMTDSNRYGHFMRQFLRRTDGGMTILGIYFFVFMAIFAAFAVDGMNISLAQTHLQKAADQAAHAALYNSSFAGGDPADSEAAKAKAIEVVSATLPPARFGTAIEVKDITFGRFDHLTRTFTPDPNSTEAVMAETGFTRSRFNSLNTYLFKLIGYDSFDIERRAVYETYEPGCMREGFVAEGVVDVQSNNNFTKGFCLHSNEHISMNGNNSFQEGTIVSMEDLDNLDLPASGFETNVGLQAALRQGTMNLRILNRIDDMIALYRDPNANVPGDTPPLPDYITDKHATPIRMMTRLVETADLTPGKVYDITCPGQTLRLDANATMKNVVIITNCIISFVNGASGSSFENMMILTSNTDPKSINSPAQLRIGANDGCKEGGGTVIATLGGMDFVAGVQFYGSQFLARGKIHFNANATGEGTSLISGETISGTSNMDMTLCGNGTGEAIEMDYFRMVL